MNPGNDFLLHVYRDARELACDEFQHAALARVQTHFPFSAAFWGDGQLVNGDSEIVPTALHAENIDQQFLVDWSRAHPADPALPIVLSHMGRALRVLVPRFYAAMPELAALGAKHDIRSMTTIVVPAIGERGVHWLSLFRAEAGTPSSDTEMQWLEGAMPHLAEALRINRALHGAAAASGSASPRHVAVAEASCGRLLRADSEFLAMLGREWPSFDGRVVPPMLMAPWRVRQPGATLTFAHLARKVRIDGRRAGELVFLSAQAKSATESLTPRQQGIAELYAQGLSHKEIAQRCSLAPATVRNHLALIYAALGVHGKLELASLVQRLAAATARSAPRATQQQQAAQYAGNH